MKKGTGIFLLLTLICIANVAISQSDTTKVVFSGVNSAITYTKNRQIKQAVFTLKNNSKQEVIVKYQAAFLVRGKSQELLENASFRIFSGNKWRKVKEIILKPGQNIKITITFKGFTIYTGTKYHVMAVVVADGKKLSATSTFELNKLPVDDKNKYKQGDGKR